MWRKTIDQRKGWKKIFLKRKDCEDGKKARKEPEEIGGVERRPKKFATEILQKSRSESKMKKNRKGKLSEINPEKNLVKK